MPCGGMCDDYRSGYASGATDNQHKLDEMKEMLCSACRVLERNNYDFDENPLLSKWWDKHKKEDEAKARVEAQRLLEIGMCQTIATKPLHKLTKADLALLKKHGYL